MKCTTISVLVVALLSGCSSRILVDRIEGRASLPCSRIADLRSDRPGALLVGVGAAIRKPAEIELKSPSEDSLVEGRQRWVLPGWSLGGHLAWTPFEGVTLVPEGFLAGRGQDLTGDFSATMGLHAEAGWVAWQVEGRLGASWTRSRTTWRTRVEDIKRDTTWLDSLREERREGLVPWLQGGIQIQSAIPRQPAQLWILGRWGMHDPALLSDEAHDAILPQGLMDWQMGCGLHRRFGRRNTLTLGVLHEIYSPLDMATADATTEIVIHWDYALVCGGHKEQRTDGTKGRARISRQSLL